MKKSYDLFFLSRNRYLVFPLDLLLIVSSYLIAQILRFDSFNPAAWGYVEKVELYKILLILIFSKGTVFIIMGLYKSVWIYASLHDLYLILKTTVISSLIFISILIFYNRLVGISRSALVLDCVILFILLSFRSFSWRIFRDLIIPNLFEHEKKALILGAGDTANRLARELRSNPSSLSIKPVGLLDDDHNKIGANIQGIPVLGLIEDLEKITRKMEINVVIIGTKIKSSRVREIYRYCESEGIHCKTLPSLPELLYKSNLGNSIRDLNIEDLLGRDVVSLETNDIKKMLEGKNILITGAGGSIGSEVTKQLLRYNPSALILFDQGETPLYEIDHELKILLSGSSTRSISVIGDVRNKAVLDKTMRDYDVHVVFHCAAYKHVPMMELNPGEAVLNNVFGTINVADAARDAGVEKFVMISTDKAVNPVNIMGATKRIAEIYIQNLARSTETKYITVRFGNVLGSNGSVIPLFKKQIEQGGPLTVTHPEIIRFFMTIPEAAGLVIQAGAMGQEGEIFILDMGEPVKIADLAEDMIRLAGLVPGEDIKIQYIGLRPGEKLFEELLLKEEGIQPTRHEKIYIAMSRSINLSTLKNMLEELRLAAMENERGKIDEIIGRILPEYNPRLNYKPAEKQI
jgi:FlaA1/EpsC-like NDP-sugar epimerase